jgi:Zn-dependent protease with chaperone function
MAFWLLALAFPFFVLPAFFLVAPFRADDTFGARYALLSTGRWNAVRFAGIGVDRVVLALLALGSILLFLRDLVPFVMGMVREWRRDARGAIEPPATLVALVEELGAQTGVRTPVVMLLPTEAPVLFARGLWRPVLVLSTGVPGRLSQTELRAALVHELAHIRFRDPLAGWLLMAARLIMFWNPAVQLVCRAIAQEMEQRADHLAVGLTGAPGFAGALRALTGRRRAPAGADAGLRASVNLFAERLHDEHIGARLASLAVPDARLPFARTRLALVATTLTVMLFFVV